MRRPSTSTSGRTDEANRDPNTGGLVVYLREAPLDWDFEAFNNEPERLMQLVHDENIPPIRIPHRCNRAVVFNADLIHATDTLHWHATNRRINVTMLFGALLNRDPPRPRGPISAFTTQRQRNPPHGSLPTIPKRTARGVADSVVSVVICRGPSSAVGRRCPSPSPRRLSAPSWVTPNSSSCFFAELGSASRSMG